MSYDNKTPFQLLRAGYGTNDAKDGETTTKTDGALPAENESAIAKLIRGFKALEQDRD
jgi:hypothetical protein